MHFIRYKIVSDKIKTITLNNEAVVQTPVALQWPSDNAFFIDDITINPQEISAVQNVTVYKLSEEDFLIKLKQSAGDAKVEYENKYLKIVNTGAERGVVFEDSFYVADEIELKGNKCTVTKNLHTAFNHHRIVVFTDKIEQDYVATKDMPDLKNISLAFLQCVKVGDFVNAQKLTSIKLSPYHLQEFFGKFEIIDSQTVAHPTLNPNFYVAQKLEFVIQKGLITDIK